MIMRWYNNPKIQLSLKNFPKKVTSLPADSSIASHADVLGVSSPTDVCWFEQPLPFVSKLPLFKRPTSTAEFPIVRWISKRDNTYNIALERDWRTANSLRDIPNFFHKHYAQPKSHWKRSHIKTTISSKKCAQHKAGFFTGRKYFL